MICHGSVGIGSDLIGSFVDLDPYCVQVLQLLHISKTACLIQGQNSTSLTMCTFDGPKFRTKVVCMDFQQHLSLHGLRYHNLCAFVDEAIVGG